MNRVGRWATSLFTLSFVPRRWRLPLFGLAGAVVGLGLSVGHVSRATSYLSDDPETCINCHVMVPQYATWQHSSHMNVATCNDCHVPHDNPISKLAFKAEDGLRHSYVFTLRLEPQVIRLSERAVPVVEANCRRCHEQTVNETDLAVHQQGDLRCWDCHRAVPHGRVRSLSATPRVMTPQLPGVGTPRQEPRVGGRPPRQEE